MSLIFELLLPSTDRLVLIELTVVLGGFAVALIATRRHPDVRIFSIGLTVLVLAFFGIRALH